MATPTNDKLRLYYPSKYLTADNDAITQQTADAGGSVTTIVDAALMEVDDYWNGAVGWFDGNTSTGALQGAFFHVSDFDAATDTLTLYKDLPTAPAVGDTYRLVLGGNWRSDQELFGLLVGGVLPEEVSVTGTNITGLTIKKASPTLGAGTLTVFFDFSGLELFIKMDSESYGVGVDVSGNVTDGVVFGADGEKWLQFDSVAASLPGSDQTDTFTLTVPERTFVPDFEGAETSTGKTRYRLEIVKNTDGADSMVGLEVWSHTPDGTASTIAAGESLGTTEGSFDADDVSDWPTASFWMYNVDEDDCRYVKYRSGNTLYCAAAGAGLRGYTAASWDAADVISVMSDIDIGLDAPSTLQFESPADEETAPSGVSFGTYGDQDNALSIGTLAADSIYGVWIKETIMAGHRGRADINAATYYSWS